MTQAENSMIPSQPPIMPLKAPITNDHYLLPLLKAKYAPSKCLTSDTGKADLIHFLEYYNHLCTHYEISSPLEKCKGLIGYCAPKLARLIAKFPAYVKGDFTGLVATLHYFMGEEEDSYNLGEVDRFTRKWRKKPIASRKQFKRYHEKFFELVGRAIGLGTIDQKEYNRFFWEGIHHHLRKKVEERLSLIDPNLDVSVPFDMDDVIKAVSSIFNKRRFDQHLLTNEDSDSDSESESEDNKPSRKQQESDEEDSDDEDTPQKKHSRKKTSFILPSKSFPKLESRFPKRVTRDEVTQLTDKFNDLKLFLMRKESGQQPAGNFPPNQPMRTPYPYNNPQNRNQFPYPRPPFNNPSPQSNNRSSYNNPSFTQPPPQFVNASYNNPQQRSLPPHMTQNPSSNPPPQDPYCFGCGQSNHFLRQCTEVNTLLNQGIINRNPLGKLCWPDGGTIYRERDENWVQAISRLHKSANAVRAQIGERNQEEAYEFVGVQREDSDASSDEQEELGWSSGTIADCYAVGADRSGRVSREARRTVQTYPPRSSQRVKELPKLRKDVNTGKQNPAIHSRIDLDSRQHGAPHQTTPFDTHQNEFEGKFDHQLLPMDIDEGLPKKPGHHGPKVTTNQPRTNLPKTPNPGSMTEKVSTGIIEELMKKDVTVQLEGLLEIAPTVRRSFLNAVKGQHGALRQTQDQKEKDGAVEKKVLEVNLWQPLAENAEGVKLETRDDLLYVSARIGDSAMEGVFDSGSQANIISEECAKASGLPIQIKNLQKVRISGVNGGLAKCVGIIPEAAIYVTESGLETTGQLLVIEDSSFKLLLGRPWGTRNGAGIREAPEGTYLSFDSGGDRFEFNVAPSKSYRRKIRELGLVVSAQRVGRARGDEIAVGAVSWDSPASDSEKERSHQDSPPNYNQVEDFPPSLTQPDPDQSDEGREEREQQSHSEREKRDWKQLASPPAPVYQQPKEARPVPKSMVIETELQEDYIKMVQKGIDEKGWEEFRAIEKQRMKEGKDKWEEWKRSREDTPESENFGGSTPEEYPNSPLSPPGTPPTPEPAQRNPSHRVRKLEPPQRTTVRIERRSKRVRRETRKAQESDFWKGLKKRRYEREEKLTREKIERTRKTARGNILTEYEESSMDEDSEGGTRGKRKGIIKRVMVCRMEKRTTKETDGGNEDTKINENSREVEDRSEGRTLDRGIVPEEADRESDEPGYEDWARDASRCQGKTYRHGRSFVTRTDLGKSIEAGEVDNGEVQPLAEAPDRITMSGKNGRCERGKTYQEISREELAKIIEWCDNLPGNREGGKRFLLYSSLQETIVLTEIGDDRGDPPRKAKGVRILELERGHAGRLKEVPGTRFGKFPKFLGPVQCERDKIALSRRREMAVTGLVADGLTTNGVERQDTKCIEGGHGVVTSEGREEEEREKDEAGQKNGREVTKNDRDEEPTEEDKAPGHGWTGPLRPDKELMRKLEVRFPRQKNITCLPATKRPGPSLLAAQELTPLVYYDWEEDVEFYARGAILTWEEDARPRHYRGNALIRMSQRDISPHERRRPSRKKVQDLLKQMNEDRERIRRREGEKENVPSKLGRTDDARMEPTRRHRDGRAGGGEDDERGEMTGKELEAVVSDLMEEPLDQENHMRTYEIQKHTDGIVTARRISSNDSMARKLEQEMGEECVRKKRKNRNRGPKPERLTELGGDPHAPDRQPGPVTKQNQNARLEWEERKKGAEREYEGKAREDPEEGDEMLRTAETIKEKRGTYREDSSPTPSHSLPPASSNLNETISNSEMTNSSYPQPTPPSLRTYAALCNPQPLVRQGAGAMPIARPTDQGFHVGACPNVRRPGLVAASHLTEVSGGGINPLHPLFFGYGAAVVVDDVNGTTRTLYGNVLVHLMTEPLPPYANTPPPPPQGRSEVARAVIFRGESVTRRPPGYRPLEVENTARTNQPFRFNPETPEVHPPARPGVAILATNPSERGGGLSAEEVNVAKVLVSLCKNEKRVLGNSPVAPIPPVQRKAVPTPSAPKISDPHLRGVEFVQKGALPGNVPNILPVPPVKPSEEPTIGRTSPAEPAREYVQFNPKSLEQMVADRKNDPDDAMDISDYISDSDESYDSIPELEGVLSSDEGISRPGKVVSRVDDENRAQQRIWNVPGRESPPPYFAVRVSAKGGKVGEKALGMDLEYRLWENTMVEVEKQVKEKGRWKCDEVRDLFVQLQMIGWWLTLCYEESKEEHIDWRAWKERMVDEWTRRHPEVLPTVFRWMADDLEGIDKRARAIKVLAARKEKGQTADDVEMNDDYSPKGPTPSPITAYAPSPEPAHPRKEEGERDEPDVGADEFRALRQRMEDLEEQTRTLTREMKKKMKRLEDDLYEDNADLADVRWRTAELEGRRWKAGGKKEGQRKRNRMPHRYPTRFSIAQGDETLGISRRDYASIGTRAAKMEERIERQRREVDELREEVVKLQALTPKISELSAAFESFRNNQVRINLVTFRDLLRLRTRLQEDIDPRLGSHTRDIATLTARYSTLLAIASNLLGMSAAHKAITTVPCPPLAPYQTTNHPTSSLPPRLQPGPYRIPVVGSTTNGSQPPLPPSTTAK